MGVFWFCVVASHIKRIFFCCCFFLFLKNGAAGAQQAELWFDLQLLQPAGHSVLTQKHTLYSSSKQWERYVNTVCLYYLKWRKRKSRNRELDL